MPDLPRQVVDVQTIRLPLDAGLTTCSDGPDWSPTDILYDSDVLGLAMGYQLAWLDCKIKLGAVADWSSRNGIAPAVTGLPAATPGQ